MNAITQRIAADLGVSPAIPKLTSEWTSLGTFVIDPDTLGAFGPAIESMTVEIFAGKNFRGKTYVKYDYTYKHWDGGTNGYRVEFTI